MTSFIPPDPLARAERYYGLTLSKQLLTASDEHLTEQTHEDLFEAHLRTNYSYFGGIDKTLSGFFVLSDKDDNYTLADVRDPQGGIYWQDHETREISLLFASLDDYIAYQRELAAQDEWEEYDERQLQARYAPHPTFAPGLHPSTPELADRYQWLVWLLSQMNRFQTDADLVSSGISHFFHFWKTPDHALAIFEQELPLLKQDPHLATYWLLHHLCTANQSALLQALQVCQDIHTPLYQAFAEHLNQFTIHDTLRVLPSFRTRRSNFLFALFYQAEEHGFTPLLQSFQEEQELQLRMHELLSGTNENRQAALRQKSATARSQHRPLARVSAAIQSRNISNLH